MKKTTVERDSIINMAVELIRAEKSYQLTLNKILGGTVVSGTFTSEVDISEERARVTELRTKRKQL